MKGIFFMAMITNALIISGLTSCEKDNLSPVPGGNTSPAVPTYTTTINLVAYHWVKDAYGIYTNTFGGVISPGNINNHKVKIYLVENGKETQINSFISFMGGELWATNTQTDVEINYRCSEQNLPFSHLVIKVVIE